MSEDVVFECPRCRQWLEAPGDLAGLFVECPKCGSVVKVPRGREEATTVEESALPPPAREDENQLKGSTIRIQLPPNLGVPEPPRRRITIRRKG